MLKKLGGLAAWRCGLYLHPCVRNSVSVELRFIISVCSVASVHVFDVDYLLGLTIAAFIT